MLQRGQAQGSRSHHSPSVCLRQTRKGECRDVGCLLCADVRLVMTHTSMVNQSSRKEARTYDGDKTVSSASGFRKPGQLRVNQ